MASKYTVKADDTLSAIAQKYRTTWQTIYEHADNADFRSKRPNPNLIYPGDELVINDGTPAATAILYGVDGTGPHDDTEYDQKMRDSFVNQIVRASPIAPQYKRYSRGPDWKGFGKKLILPSTVRDDVKGMLAHVPTQSVASPIYLTGYSRGGAIVINAASLLKLENVNVEAIFLFDAVERSFKLEAEFVPGNVKYCYHAVRDRSAGSRESFGNCGMHRAGGQAFDGFSRFFTTHGGMGGTPWGPSGAGKSGFIEEGFPDGATKVTPAAETAGMQKVRTWMWAFLQTRGVV